MEKIIYKTSIGTFIGNKYDNAYEFLGIPYAKANRFEYCERIDEYGEFDATEVGNSCPQFRGYHPHLDNPERLFYYKEFRDGIEFKYAEDCLNLNIYTPINASNCPVILFFHGGGFNSGSKDEDPFKGFKLVDKNTIVVFANYRVGILGYFSHEEIEKKYHRNGNFGLDDQLNAIKWVNEHIQEFGGDKNNITIAGQSAGAMSVQYLCLNHDNKGLFNRALMMSGAGLFPKISLPKKAKDTYEYWSELMELAGCKTFEEFKNADLRIMHDAYDEIKNRRKDNINNMMPVVDNYLIKDDVDKLIHNPLKIDYMLGYTSNDMFAPMLASIAHKYGKANNAYVYYFDIDQPGDNNGAFHSSDLRYVFGTLENSWRPYRQRDKEISNEMIDYLSNFAKNGDPNGNNLPLWKKMNEDNNEVLCFKLNETKMGHPSYFKLTKNFLTKGDPKA